jgi:hypothetical protein
MDQPPDHPIAKPLSAKLRDAANKGLDLFRSQFPSGRPTFEDFGKSAATGIGLGFFGFALHLIGWAFMGVSNLDAEPISRFALLAVGWTLVHFAYLVARQPHVPL